MARCFAKTKMGTRCKRITSKGSLFCFAHRNKNKWWRILSLSAIASIIVAVLGIIADISGILGFFDIKPPLIIQSVSNLTIIPSPSIVTSVSNIELINISDQRIIVKSDDHFIETGNIVHTQETVTVIFKIINNGLDPITIKSLVIGARGPGVTCEDKNEKKWTAINNPFPSSKDINLDPGQEYEYQGSRIFYLPGKYFLEPVIQDSNGKWGGIPTYTCFNITVMKTEN